MRMKSMSIVMSVANQGYAFPIPGVKVIEILFIFTMINAIGILMESVWFAVY